MGHSRQEIEVIVGHHRAPVVVEVDAVGVHGAEDLAALWRGSHGQLGIGDGQPPVRQQRPYAPVVPGRRTPEGRAVGPFPRIHSVAGGNAVRANLDDAVGRHRDIVRTRPALRAINPEPAEFERAVSRSQSVVDHARDQAVAATAHDDFHGPTGPAIPVVGRLAPAIVINDGPAGLAPAVRIRPDQCPLAVGVGVILAEPQGLHGPPQKLGLEHLAVQHELGKGQTLWIGVMAAYALGRLPRLELVRVAPVGEAVHTALLRTQVLPDRVQVARGDGTKLAHEPGTALVVDFVGDPAAPVRAHEDPPVTIPGCLGVGGIAAERAARPVGAMGVQPPADIG